MLRIEKPTLTNQIVVQGVKIVQEEILLEI